MSRDDNDRLMSHEYDGIREFDNPLPMWWLATFFITIIFGFLYWIHYEFAGGPTLQDELQVSLQQNEALKKSAPRKEDNEEELAKLEAQAPVLASGATVYSGKCASCHGPELQGLIGPNLVDEYWIHGKGQRTAIAAIIRNGVLDKGMPQWQGVLSEDEIKAVIVYVHSKKGSSPPNPKPPQGEKVVQN